MRRKLKFTEPLAEYLLGHQLGHLLGHQLAGQPRKMIGMESYS